MRRALLIAWLVVPAVQSPGIGGAVPVRSESARPTTSVEPRAASGLIAGRVVDATSGARLSNAIVFISMSPSRVMGVAPTPFSTRRVLVDREGAFVFDRLPAGTYALRVEKRGYAEGAFGRKEPSGAASAIELGDSEIRTDVPIGLWKLAAIEGTVVDDLGDPAPNLTLHALRRRVVAGHRLLTRSGVTSTDDRGRFRFSSLEPGEYIVFVPRGAPTDPPPGPDGRTAVRQATFYPGASTPGDSVVIAVGPGAQRTGVAIQLRLVPGVRVSGSVKGLDGPAAAASVRLLPAFASQFGRDPLVPIDTATALTDEHGAFTLLGVPPGEYELRVDVTVPGSPMDVRTMPETLWSAGSIAVGSSDLTNVGVVLRPGARVTGRLEFDGTGAQPTGAQVSRGWVYLLAAVSGTLEGLRAVGRAPIDANGQFATLAVPGGQYVLRVEGPGRWSMASAMRNGRDVADGALDLNKGDATDVVVRMSDRPTSLSGPVLDGRGVPDTDASVLVFPVDPALWIDCGAQPRRFRAARADEHGAFAVDGLPAGEYFLAAMDAAEVGDWKDLRLLDRLGLTATRVRLADGERQTVSLKTVARPATGDELQHGPSAAVTDAHPVATVTIGPATGGAIAGTVRDQDGQPILGVIVTATAAGAPVGMNPHTVTTDDIGRYRVFLPSPGEYIVDAALPGAIGPTNGSVRAMQPGEVERTIQQARSGSAIAGGAPATDRGTTVGWVRVFYPGATDRAAATPVAVATGEERGGIDLQLHPVTLSRLIGTVTMPFGAPAQGVRVSAAPAGGATAGRTLDDQHTGQADAQGRYTISDLLPGTYDVTALNASASPSAGQVSVQVVERGVPTAGDPPLWASAQAVIAGHDVTLPLKLQPGVNVSGQLIFDGVEPGVLEVARQRISFRNTASFVAPPVIQTGPTGKFQLAGVIPGKYAVSYQGSPSGRWALRAVTADGVDVLEAPLDVRAGQDVRALVLTLTDHPSRLVGSLHGGLDPAAARPTVVVFPVDRTRWTSTLRVRTFSVGADGRFSATNLPDGDYFVAVMTVEGDLKSPPTLERLLPSAIRVAIASGKDTVCELRIGG